MNLPFQSKSKTLIGRLEAAGDEARKRIETVRRDAAKRIETAGDDVIVLVRSVPERLDTSRKRALAVVGGAASAAAGFAFWRSRHEKTSSVHEDPAQARTPWKAAPPPPANGGSGAQPPMPPAGGTTAPGVDSKAAPDKAAGARSN